MVRAVGAGAGDSGTRPSQKETDAPFSLEDDDLIAALDAELSCRYYVDE